MFLPPRQLPMHELYMAELFLFIFNIIYILLLISGLAEFLPHLFYAFAHFASPLKF